MDTHVEHAIDVVLFLLGDRCNTVDRGNVCSLLELQCNLTGGTLPLALLTFYTAGLILDREAIKLASLGKVTIDELVIDYTKQATELRQIAKALREQADNAKAKIEVPAVVVSMVDHCIKPITALYELCKCTLPVDKLLVYPSNCSFNCCKEC